MLKILKRHFLTSSILGIPYFLFPKGLTHDFEQIFSKFPFDSLFSKKGRKKILEVLKSAKNA